MKPSPRQALTLQDGMLTFIGPRGSGTTFTGAHAVAQCLAAGKKVAIVTRMADDVLEHQASQISLFMDGDAPTVSVRSGTISWPKRQGRATIMGLDDQDLMDRARQEPFDVFWLDAMIYPLSTPTEISATQRLLRALRKLEVEIIWTGQGVAPGQKNPSTPAAL